MQKVMRKISVIFLALWMLLTVCACAPAGLKNAERQLKNQGYKVQVTQFESDSEEYQKKGHKGYLVAKNSTFGWELEAHLFVSGKVANEYYATQAQGKTNVSKKDCWVVWGSYVSVHNFVGDI